MNSSQETQNWRGSFLKYVLFLGFVILVGLSIDYWLHDQRIISEIELVAGLMMFVVYLLLVFKKIGWKAASYFGWTGILFILLMVLLYGGIGGMGVIWWGLLPMLSFMFFGVEWGLFATLSGSSIPIVVMMIEYGGVDVSYFDILQLRQLILMIFVMGSIMSFYERAVKVLIKKLSDDTERINLEAEERIAVEEELAQKLLELNKRAEKDEKVRMAVLNILEDERQLETQLKKEKEGVERKVDERTLELSVERNRMKAVLDNLVRGILVIDKKKRTVLLNRKIFTLLGDPKEINYKVLSEFFKEINLDRMVDQVEKTTQMVSKEKVLVGSKFFDLFLVPVPMETGVNNIAIFVEDVTYRVSVERSRDEFFSIASHELRTPLTAIRGNAEMILDNYKDKIKDKEVLEMLSDMHEGSIRLIEIVNDFLNVSRLEMGKIDFKIEKINLIDLLKETMEEFRVSNLKPNLDLMVNYDKKELWVMADKDRLKQVLINMIGNAFKFTETGGVYFEKFDSKDGTVSVDVRDTGSGIAVEQQPLLFRKFQQAGDSLYTRDTSKGTGLGLYISKLLIEGMKGSIGLRTSALKKGSVFYFSLPVAE